MRALLIKTASKYCDFIIVCYDSIVAELPEGIVVDHFLWNSLGNLQCYYAV